MPTRAERLRVVLITRLERFRGRMSDAEFDTLINDVARTAARFVEIDERELGHKPMTPEQVPVFREPETRT